MLLKACFCFPSEMWKLGPWGTAICRIVQILPPEGLCSFLTFKYCHLKEGWKRTNFLIHCFILKGLHECMKGFHEPMQSWSICEANRFMLESISESLYTCDLSLHESAKNTWCCDSDSSHLTRVPIPDIYTLHFLKTQSWIVSRPLQMLRP